MSTSDLRSRLDDLGWTVTNPLDLLPQELASPAADLTVAAMAKAIGPTIATAEDSAVNLTIAGALVAAKLAAPGIGGVVNLRVVALNLKHAYEAVLAAADAVDENQLASRTRNEAGSSS